MIPFSRALPGLAALLFLSGCASISVQPGTEYATPRMPDKVYVAFFGTTHGEFNVDREDAELVSFKKNLQLLLQVATVTDLTNRLIPAAAARPHEGRVPESAWLIRGEFIRVNQGSRLLRGAIGFGAGGTKLETKVEVYDLAHDAGKPFLVFSTTGGSNAEPGAVTAVATDPLEIAIQVALGGASGIAHGLTEDSKRTAREITAMLSDYMYRSRWISREQWIKPKNYSN